jgi:hypothetical protein
MQELLLLTSEIDDCANDNKKRGGKALRLVVNISEGDSVNVQKSSINQGTLMISGALMISDDSRNQVQSLDELFPDGFTSTTVTNLFELQDSLNKLLPAEEKPADNGVLSSERSFIARQEEEIATSDEMKRFELFRSVIEHEDELLNHRVSWIILAQSFLMAAYITTGVELNSLRFVTAGVGLMTVVVTLPAILAAGSNIEVQQQVYFRQISSDDRCMILHGHNRDLSTKPRTKEMKERLKEGHALPNMAFRSRWSVKILTTALMLGAVQFAGWILLIVAVIYQHWDLEFP